MSRQVSGTNKMVASAVPHSIGTGAFTVEGWIRSPASWVGYNGIAGFGSTGTPTGSVYPDLYLSPSGALAILFIGGTLNATSNVSVPADSAWHHVAWIRNGAGVWHTYVDGVKDTSGAMSDNTIINNENFQLYGSGGDHADTLLFGHFALWTSNLSDANIVSLASGAAKVTVGTPYAYWILNGTDSPELDSQVGSNDLTLTGTSAGGSEPPISGGSTTPADPSDLDITSITSSQINLSWVDNSVNPYLATGFTLQYALDDIFTSPVEVDIPLGTLVSFVFSLLELTEYFFRILAYNDDGDSGWSSTISGITLVGSPVSDIVTWEPTQTPWGYMTQFMGNQYPYWHAANAKTGGRTQRVINSLGGFQLTQLLSKIRRLRANLFLSTADVSEPHKVWIAPRPVTHSEQDVFVNLLSNPSLSKIYPQRLGPWGWSSEFIDATGDWEIKRGRGLYGYYGVRLTATNEESISLAQDNDLIFRVGNSYTATVWYAGMRPARTPQILSPVSGAQLQVTTQYSDGVSEVSSVFLKDDTDGAWTRSSVTVSPNRDTHNIQVSVVVTDYDGETVVIEVGGLQLEAGIKSSVFSENIDSDGILFLIYEREEITESTAWGNITYSRQKRIRVNDSLDYQSLLEQHPDRATVTLTSTEVGTSNSVLDAIIEAGGQQFSLGWRIASNLIERYNVDIRQSEVFGYYKIADLYGDGGRSLWFVKPEDMDVTTTYEALTVAGEWLYVIAKEVYLGKTQRVLKICSPYIRWEDTNHLESYADIYIDSGSGSCTFLGTVDSRYDKLLMTVSSVDYTIDLLWDSVARNSDGTLIFRSDPGDSRVVQ